MRRKGPIACLLSVILASVPYLIGARPLEGLDPTTFGSILDKATRRTVNTGAELRAYLSDVTVSTLLLNGRCPAPAKSALVAPMHALKRHRLLNVLSAVLKQERKGERGQETRSRAASPCANCADSVILSSEFWTSTVVIQQRAVQIISGGQLPAYKQFRAGQGRVGTLPACNLRHLLCIQAYIQVRCSIDVTTHSSPLSQVLTG